MSKKSVKPKKSPVPFYALLTVIAAVGAFAIYQVTRPSVPTAVTIEPGASSEADAKGYIYGDPDAPITIIEYGDFECPGCAQFAFLDGPDIKQRIVDAGLANFQFYDFPLAGHANTLAAHLAAACADDQGKFWQMHDLIFAGQDKWNTLATRNPRKPLSDLARELELNMSEWDACFDSRKHLGRIEANRNTGIARGVNATPTIQIGNQVYRGGITADQVKAVVDSLSAAGITPVGAP